MALPFRRWLGRVLALLSWLYPGSLLVSALLLRFVGESWWVTALALYLPRLALAVPLPFLAVALLWTKRFRLLALQLASLVLLLFPLMGLTLSFPSSAPAGAPRLKILSYNVNSGYGGFPDVAAEIRAHAPDLVFIQELPYWAAAPLVEELKRSYAVVESAEQFVVASRFPISASVDPTRLPYYGRQRSPRFMKYEIATPLGAISFYNLHTVSPRGSFYSVRGQGLRREIMSGRLFAGAASHDVQSTTGLRILQVQTLAEMAAKETGPVIIVGDGNLPTLSPTRARYLGRYQDGFSSAGSGFGYTFPARSPWMRIDMILASDEFRFVSFEVGKGQASDHRCVVAELVKR